MEQPLAGPPLPADVIIVILFLIFAVLKGNRGFYESLVPLTVTLISLAGAAVLTWVLEDMAVAQVYPWAQKELASRMDLSAIRAVDLSAVTSQLERLMPETMTNILRKLKLELPGFVEEAFRTAVPGAAAQSIAEDAVAGMLLPVTRSLVRVLLFFVSFLLLKLVLSLAARVLGLAFDLPVVRWFDRLGGALIGVLWCAAVLFILCWLMDLLVPEIFERVKESSRILTYVFAEK